jgi:formylglycine-generating enzyme required for sulfatase activity
MKPANIIVDQESGAIKITDFGIAKILGADSHTEPGVVLGSLFYMAPEQLRGGSVDGRADQFALAVLAQRMLTGASVYSANTMRRLAYQITQELPPSAHLLNPNLPPAVDAVLAKGLAKEPADRYLSCSAFVDGLAGVLGWSDSTDQEITDDGGQRETSEEERSKPRPSQRFKRLPIVGLVLLVTAGVVAALVLSRQHKPAPLAIPVVSAEPAIAPPLKLPDSLSQPSGNMVLVEGGATYLGPERRPVHINAFYIDATEVTNAAYLAFCRATGHPAPHGGEQAPGANPVVNVSFYDAQAFARWAEKRLPTGDEWEKAVRTSDGRNYPWGNDWREGAANVPAASKRMPHLAEAWSFPEGVSAYGALNMVGNVWQWVDTRGEADATAFRRLSQNFKDLRPPLSATEPMYQVRGGSFRYGIADSDRPKLVNDWLVLPARLASDDLGFRCVKDP